MSSRGKCQCFSELCMSGAVCTHLQEYREDYKEKIASTP